MTKRLLLALALGAGLLTAPALAQMADGMTHGMQGHGQDMSQHTGMSGMQHGHMQMHGATSLMGRHLMPRGKFMLSFRLGHMEMNGLRSGTTDINPDTLVTTVPNRFAGMPGQPPTLRVAPLWMKGDMKMLGAMYGLTDRITLTAMIPYVKKEMTSLVYAGLAGTTRLGTNRMTSERFGDARVGALFDLHRDRRTHVVARMGLSLPTGSITETGPMLSPMGMRMVRRMSYGMQLGSGTYDLLPSLSWQTGKGRWNWGAHASGVIRLGSNDEGYSLGDEAVLNLWASYKPARWVSLNARLQGKTAGRIDGIDPNIAMPMPGADPLNYGGETVALYAGVDLTPHSGGLKGHRLGVEVGAPLYQSLNGPRLKQDWSVSATWRKAF